MSDLLAKVKREVRSLLLSLKGGCSPARLLQDYHTIIGEPLPFLALGYSTFSQFIDAIPDVARVQSERNAVVLVGVEDESTKHIARMVRNQRTNNRLKPPRVSYRPAGAGSLPKPPMDFEVNLAHLFLSYPNGIAVNDFIEAYGRRFGRYPDFAEWGFTSVDHLLRSLPHIVRCEQSAGRDTCVVRPVAKSPEAVAALAVKNGVADLPSYPKQSMEERWMMEEDNWETEEGVEVSSAVESKTNGSRSTKTPPPQDSLHSIELSPSRRKLIAELCSRSPPVPPARKRPSIPKKLLFQVEQLLQTAPTGIRASRFPVEFKGYFQENLPVAALGFTSVVHLLSALPVCELERAVHIGDWVVYAKGAKKLKVADGQLMDPVSAGLTDRVHCALRCHPDGVPVSEFPTIFKELVGSALPVEELGFSSTTHLLANVHGVKVVKNPGSSVMKVYLTVKKRSEEREEEEEEEEEEEGETVCGSTSADGRCNSPKIPIQPLPEDTMCPVYVSHVKSPSCIYLQLIGEATSRALESLSEDITHFYSSSRSFSCATKKLAVGEVCCTVFNNDGYWYRGEILHFPSTDIAEVLYIDYGNTGKVPRESLREPRPHHLTLPAQAVPSRLANIKPVGTAWSRGATQMLFQMTKDRPLYATVTSSKGGVMSVHLTDTSTDRDLHINDVLVREGMAVFSPDTDEDQEAFDLIQLEPPPMLATGDTLPTVRPPKAVAVTETPSLLDTPTILSVLPLQPTVLASPQPSLVSVSATPSQPPLVSVPATPSQPPLISVSATPSQPPLISVSATPSQPPPVPATIDLSDPSSVSVQLYQLQQYLQHLQQLLGHKNPLFQQAAVSLSKLIPITTPLPSQQTPPPTPTPTPPPPPPPPPPTSLPPPTSPPPPPPPPPTSLPPPPPTPLSPLLLASTHPPSPSIDPVVVNTAPQLSARPAAKQLNIEAECFIPSSCSHHNSGEQSTVLEESSSPNLLAVKRVQLAGSHWLHAIRYQDGCYVTSAELSGWWYWREDHLQALLARRSTRPLCAVVVSKKGNGLLFGDLLSARLITSSQKSVMLFSLNDVPSIVSMFEGPSPLLTATNREVNLWRTKGMAYFKLLPAPPQTTPCKSLPPGLAGVQPHPPRMVLKNIPLSTMGWPASPPPITPSLQPPSLQTPVTPSLQLRAVTPSYQPSVTPSLQIPITPSLQLQVVTSSYQPSVTPSHQPAHYSHTSTPHLHTPQPSPPTSRSYADTLRRPHPSPRGPLIGLGRGHLRSGRIEWPELSSAKSSGDHNRFLPSTDSRVGLDTV